MATREQDWDALREGEGRGSIRARQQAARTEAALFDRAAPTVTAGRFVVVERIGVGGMGVVYRAFDPELERIVALKVLDRAMRSDATRIQKEARALARLNHPNVVAVYEIGRDGAETFLAMEHVDGGSLADWCERHPTIDRVRTRRLLAMLRQAAAGLAAAHGTGIIHRDLKPGNILVGRDDRVRLADFGLATLSGRAPALADADHAEARTDGIAGTPAYMAPEQFEGDVGPKSDQFSLCVTFFEAISGRHPFEREGSRLVDSIRTGSPRPDRTMPRRLREALARGMSRDPAQRFDDLDQLLDALTDRRWPTAALAGVVGVASIAMLAADGEDDQPPCEVDEDLLGDAWTDARQQALERAFIEASGDDGKTAWIRVHHELSDAVDKWRQQNLDACVQSREREPALAERGQNALACSRRAALALRHVSEALLDADQRRVARATTASGVVSGLIDCENGEAPQSDRAFELASRLDEAIIAQALGEDDRLVELVTSVLEQTERGELPAIRASAHHYLVTHHRRIEDYAGVREHLEAGLFEAELADDADRVAQIWGDLATLAARQQDLDGAEFYLARAKRLQRQDRLSPARLAGLAMVEGQVFARQGQHDEAAEAFGRAVEACRASRPSSVLLGWALSDRAMSLHAAGDLEPALVAGEESETVMQAAAGEHHVDTAVIRARLGRLYLAADRPSDAQRALDQGLEILEEHPEFFALERTTARSARDRLAALEQSQR